jgi:putative ABC transport system permease protein
MLNQLPLIWKNSVRNRRRSTLTILSIAASLCLLGLLSALYHSFFFSEASPEQALRLIVRNRVSLANPLPVSYMQQIRSVPGVQEVTIFQWYGGTYKDNRDPSNFFARFALAPVDKIPVVHPEYRVPEEQRKAFASERTAALLGKKTADRHNLKIGDRVTLIGDIFPGTLELTIRGIFDHPNDNESLIFHFDYLNESLPADRKDYVSTFTIKMARPEDAESISKAVDAMFRNATLQTKTETEKAFEVSFLAFLGNVKLFLLVICGAVTFTVLLVAGNTMAMSVRERAREVGVLKTLGFTPGKILGLLIGESVMIALIGGVIGLGLASVLCAMARQMPSTFANMNKITVPPSMAALCLLAAALIGVVSCAVPAWSASRRPIVTALRFTD